MTTTLIPLGGGGASGSVTVAEDILANEGGVIRKRGALSIHQTFENGFGLIRQHHDQYSPRPAPSLGAYPRGLWVQGVGAESDGYGSADAGGGVYINLDRAREGVYVTQSWWWGIKSQTKDSIGTVTFYQDTEGWGSLLRSYYMARVNLATGAVEVEGNNGVITLADTAPVPGWNDNKYDRTYTSLTTFIGKSTDTGNLFGHYAAFQIGSKVFDLRGIGGYAKHDPSPIAQPGSSFSGGRNPGMAYTTPVAGLSGGIVIYEMLETIGDSIVA